ncbi:Imm47 family immunity protein [Niallia taxi]|uniref:Uncharacterized protein n=1 Tax=Niallia taxi TaxID=2499688 RepID=A0A437KAE1_9BACI|nr:Imm47 family immunity protein [Niallia taxi]RVT61654.1 hypothetical protein EM808_15550 [Niallia taxi]
MKVGVNMSGNQNLMNSIWFGEKSTLPLPEIKANILYADTERDVLLNLIELYKLGDFTQKPLLIQLMNRTKDEAVLNLCIRVFLAVATHGDLRDSKSAAEGYQVEFFENGEVKYESECIAGREMIFKKYNEQGDIIEQKIEPSESDLIYAKKFSRESII